MEVHFLKGGKLITRGDCILSLFSQYRKVCYSEVASAILVGKSVIVDSTSLWGYSFDVAIMAKGL